MIILQIIFLVILSFLIYKTFKKNSFLSVGWGLIFLGVLSNLIDLIIRGEVFDYFKYSSYAFNLADIAIIFGVIICLKQILCQKFAK